MSPELFSSHLTSSWLIPACLRFSQLFSTLLSSPQLMSAHPMPSHLFSHLLSSSRISSGDLSACQLVSPHLSSFQRTLQSSQLLSGPKHAPKVDLGAKASNPHAFHREDLTRRCFYTQQAFAKRSLYTQILLHRDTETFTHRELLHREACTHNKHKNLYIEKLLPAANFYIQQAFTHRSFYTGKHLHSYTEKP